jgi:uncharacterized phage protein (TIGR02218 family)
MQVYYFTDADRNISFGGQTYLAVNATDSSQFAGSAGLDADAGEVSIAAGQVIAEREIAAGTWNLATVEVDLVDYTNPAAGAVRLGAGEIGRIGVTGGRISVELRSFKNRLGKPIGETVQPTCQADFGDARCTVSLAAYTVTGTITAVTDSQVFADSGRAEATAVYDGGLITFTSGLNTGRSMEVKRFVSGGVVTLFLPLAYAVQIGDSYSLRRGCPKTVAACQGYSNFVNFRGFPFVPGNQVILNGGGA